MGKHAKLSPSSASRWSTCTASVAAQDGLPDNSSEAARIGTMCHEVGSRVLSDQGRDPDEFIGRDLVFARRPDGTRVEDLFHDEAALWIDGEALVIEHQHKFKVEHSEAVFAYTSYVQGQVLLLDGQLHVEQRVPIDHITGEAGAEGSCDAGIIGDTWVEIVDAKFGMGKVDAYEVVRPEHIDPITGAQVPEILALNEQLAMYADGFIQKFNLRDQVEFITLTIVQPFLKHVSEITVDRATLEKCISRLRAAAVEVHQAPTYRPSPDACHFCRRKGTCEAQDAAVYALVAAGFSDACEPLPVSVERALPSLGDKYAMIGFIDDWKKGVISATVAELRAGRPVVRSNGSSYKLVMGKARAGSWSAPESVETLLEWYQVPEKISHTRELISPAEMKKLAKGKRAKKGEVATEPTLAPQLWEALESFVSRPQSNTVVTDSSDPREAVATSMDGFEFDNENEES